MSFDPLDFLTLAQSMASSGAQESELRTAVGRAYYALFLMARDKMDVRRRNSVHHETIKRLKKTEGYRTMADQLDELSRLRKVADYELTPIKPEHQNWPENWSRASLLVDRIRPRLQQLK